MGAGKSKGGGDGRVELGNLQAWVDRRMHERYCMGMGSIIPALYNCMMSLATIQVAAIEVGGAVCVAMSGERSSEGRRPGEALAPEGKDKEALQALKHVVDGVVQFVEVAAARENHICPDYTTMCQTISNMRDAHVSLKDHLRYFSNPKLPPMSPSFTSALGRFKSAIAGLPPAIEALEVVSQASRLFLTEISDAKARVLGPISSAVYELEAVQHGLVRKSAFTNGKSDYEAAQARAEEACGHHLLQDAKRLRLESAALVKRMDKMLAPFVKIGQNVKGKSKIGRGDLTDEEMKSIQRYIALLLKTDMYERLEDDGGSIEDFLEALFLLGIAAGVGMTDVNAKQTGLSRKSQAILADALDSFNADQLRSSYTEWRRMHGQLAALESTKEYMEVAEDADRSMAAYREIAHRADAATRDWHSAIQGYNTSVGAICGYREKFLVRCTEEFGDAPEVVLPIDEGSDDVGREP